MALLLNSQKKAISPIIAVILLLLMTVAAAGAAFFWVQSTQRQLQSGITEQQEEFVRNLNIDLRVLSAEYALTPNTLTTFITNSGGVTVPLTPTSSQFTLRYLNGSILCSVPVGGNANSVGHHIPATIGPGSTSNVTFVINGTCALSETALLQYTFTLELSGRATVSGSFDIPAS